MSSIAFSLSRGNAHDAPEGRELLWQLPRMPEGLPMLTDRAYQGDETRQLVLDMGNRYGGPAQVEPRRSIGI